MTFTLGSFFSWLVISSWAEASPNQYNLDAESAGTYRIEAQLISPTSHFFTRLNWGQYLNGSNNNRSELFLAFEYVDTLSEALVADTFYVRAGETGSVDPIRVRSYSGGDLHSTYGTQLGFSSFGSPFEIQLNALKDSTSNTLQLSITNTTLNYTATLFSASLPNQQYKLKAIGFTAKCTSSNTENFAFGVASFSPTSTESLPLQINSHSLSSSPLLSLNLNQRLTEPIQAKWDDNSSYIQDLQPQATHNSVQLNLPLEDLRPGIARNIQISTSSLDTTIAIALAAGNHANFRDVIFSEIMADATPSLSNIPEDEYIEIYNCSNNVININGWKLIDSDTPYIIDHFWDGLLYPDSTFLIVRTPALWENTSGNISQCSNWSGLNDNGETLKLIQHSGTAVDIIEFEKSWWLENNSNTQAGRSIAKIHPRACNISSNWQPSSLPTGSSPNIYSNSSFNLTTPQLIDPHMVSSTKICLVFTPPIDPSSPLKVRTTSDSWIQAEFNGKDWTANLQVTPYSNTFIEIDSIRTCNNSSIPPPVLLAWDVIPPANSSNIVISEICHTPIVGEPEWIELTKTSSDPIDIYDLHVNGTPFINEFNTLFEFNETIRITENNFDSWRSLSSNNGTIILSKGLDTLETVNYNKCWHTNPNTFNSGSTLKRISNITNGNDPRNWTSGTNQWGNSLDSSLVTDKPETGVIWGISEGHLLWKSSNSMDSTFLKAENWSFPTSWTFTDLSQTSAISTENLDWISFWADSLYNYSYPEIFKITSLKSALQHNANAKLILNEILSEALDEHSRFIEIKNISDHTAYTNDFLITSTDIPSADSWIRLTEDAWIISPGETIAISVCPNWIANITVDSKCIGSEIPSLQKDRLLQIAKAYEETLDSYLIPECAYGISKERICPSLNYWINTPSVGATPGIANKSQCDEAADNSNSYVEVWPKSLKRSSENFRWVNVKSDQLKKCNIKIYSFNGELVYSMNFEGDFRGAWEGIDSSNNKLFPGNYVLQINGETVDGNAIHERELVVILE